jgi:chemotaxis protein histidine kinase CheA
MAEGKSKAMWWVGVFAVAAVALSIRDHLEERRAADERATSRQLAERLAAQAKEAAAAREAAKSPEQREAERREAEARADQQAKQAAERAALLAAAAKLRPKINAMPWFDACAEWGRLARQKQHTPRREAFVQRLTEGKYINSVDLAHVTESLPTVGMTACGVFAQLGLPHDINATNSALSTRQQIVYRSPRRYIYVDAPPGDYNGIVSTVQH